MILLSKNVYQALFLLLLLGAMCSAVVYLTVEGIDFLREISNTQGTSGPVR